MHAEALILVGAVAAVGVLHTIVPDHWVPIALIARQRGWSKIDTAWAAFQAGAGHVLSTLAIGLVVWIAGVAFMARFSNFVDLVASVALVAFGGWIALSGLLELRGVPHGHSHEHDHHHGHTHDLAQLGGHSHAIPHWHDHSRFARDAQDVDPASDALYAPLRSGAAVLVRHVHPHRHGGGPAHVHLHDHDASTAHEILPETDAVPPLHVHKHKTSSRAALLIVLGSSPMVEGLPAFFAAGKYGIGLICVMAVVFAASTIVTYMLLCVYSTVGLQRVKLGPVERYGEVLSGAFIALVGVAFYVWPIL
jgi:hypothetical protein